LIHHKKSERAIWERLEVDQVQLQQHGKHDKGDERKRKRCREEEGEEEQRWRKRGREEEQGERRRKRKRGRVEEEGRQRGGGREEEGRTKGERNRREGAGLGRHTPDLSSRSPS
jgi:hypothetical protein